MERQIQCFGLMFDYTGSVEQVKQWLASISSKTVGVPSEFLEGGRVGGKCVGNQ